MLIQVFSQHMQLAQEGKITFLRCPMHPLAEATFLMMHMQENDKIVLQCLACNYKVVAGKQLYENVLSIVQGALDSE